jgi:hypothetical protein
MRLWLCRAAVLAAAGTGLAGCSAGLAHQEIHGAVTLDGRPVTDGYIRFAPADGKTSSAEEFIKDGKYTARLRTGRYQVEVYSPRAQGKRVRRIAGPGQEAKEVEEMIPARYNRTTELKVDVSKEQSEHDFLLKSK